MRDQGDTDAREDLVLPVEPDGTRRRTFLKLAGFGVASATLAGCSRGPVQLVVPRLARDPGVTPGRAFHVATTCGACEARCGVLARCRDGRPIKLEGNKDHAVSRGGLCAVGQASLLDLYDGQRTDGPLVGGNKGSFEDLDAAVTAALGSASGGVRVLTRTITSPSTRQWIGRLLEKHGGQHVEWDPRSASALLRAHEAAFGVRVLPRMHFDRAEMIVSIDADFLGTWISPVEFAKDYAAGRRLADEAPTMSRHVHFESHLSLTGGAADERLVFAPTELRAALATLANLVSHAAGQGSGVAGESAVTTHNQRLEELAKELWAARGKALVVCGSNDVGSQAMAIFLNRLLGSYGTTLDVEVPSLVRAGDDAALAALIEEMQSGAVKVLIVDGLDPLYELPASSGFRDAVGGVGFVLTTAAVPDETYAVASAVAPAPHSLESWDDAEATSGHLSLTQPTVTPLRSSRTLRASIARWLGQTAPDSDLVRRYWRENLRGRTEESFGDFEAHFDRVLHDGHAKLRPLGSRATWKEGGWQKALASSPAQTAPSDTSLTLVVYSKVGLPEGRHAHNPWLQEMPDPLTTVTWDNYACMAAKTASKLGVGPGDVVSVKTDDGASVELPTRVLPGIHPSVIAIATGYGVTGTDRFSRIGPSWLEGRLTVREGGTVGSRAADLLSLSDACLRSSGRVVTVSSTGASEALAATQDHHRLEVPAHLAPQRGEVREAVLATTLPMLQKDPAHALHRHEHAEVSLWPADHENDGPRWGMVIDLSACNGCSGCVVACQAENNVPCVGKDEVARHREMTWLRMDRYFSGYGDDLRMNHQPMMCQHCANAPCETVCPVLATVHSADGLNQQVYNRCVGTRYCANNCPYKTRRFNWFEYPRREELRNLALNPDVTVRSRGVMEKCSMCVQRIQEVKAEASRTGSEIADGDIQTACQQSCPVDAITFGDLDDPESRVARFARGPRSYSVLPELNVLPGVTYLADVRNTPEKATGDSHE